MDRLDQVLSDAREVVTQRAEAELDAAGDDNETAMSGVWNEVADETAPQDDKPSLDFDVPTDDVASGEPLS